MNFPILSENRSNPSVRYRNYYYTQKTAGKTERSFKFSNWYNIRIFTIVLHF